MDGTYYFWWSWIFNTLLSVCKKCSNTPPFKNKQIRFRNEDDFYLSVPHLISSNVILLNCLINMQLHFYNTYKKNCNLKCQILLIFWKIKEVPKVYLVACAAAFCWPPLLSAPASEASFLLRHLTMQLVNFDRGISPRHEGTEIPRKSVVLNDLEKQLEL